MTQYVIRVFSKTFITRSHIFKKITKRVEKLERVVVGFFAERFQSLSLVSTCQILTFANCSKYNKTQIKCPNKL